MGIGDKALLGTGKRVSIVPRPRDRMRMCHQPCMGSQYQKVQEEAETGVRDDWQTAGTEAHGRELGDS